jgi:hypothetical protein
VRITIYRIEKSLESNSSRSGGLVEHPVTPPPTAPINPPNPRRKAKETRKEEKFFSFVLTQFEFGAFQSPVP